MSWTHTNRNRSRPLTFGNVKPKAKRTNEDKERERNIQRLAITLIKSRFYSHIHLFTMFFVRFGSESKRKTLSQSTHWSVGCIAQHKKVNFLALHEWSGMRIENLLFHLITWPLHHPWIRCINLFKLRTECFWKISNEEANRFFHRFKDEISIRHGVNRATFDSVYLFRKTANATQFETWVAVFKE